MIRPLALLPLLAALASCSSGAQVAQPSYTQYRTVRFADSETLLVTACPPVEPDAQDRCRVLRVDLKRRVTTAFEPAADRSLEDPTSADDGNRIMAVRKGRTKDERGNIPSEIVTFSPSDGRASVVYRSPTEIMFPRPAENGIVFWLRHCVTLRERYCRKEAMFRQTSTGTVRFIERRYGFLVVGPIFRWHGRTYANAESSEDMMKGDPYDFALSKENTGFWKLAAGQGRFGLEQGSTGVRATMGNANGDSSMILYVLDPYKGSTLYWQRGETTELLGTIPESVYPMNTAQMMAFDISSDNSKVVLLMGYHSLDGDDPVYRLFLFDTAKKAWQPLMMPAVRHVETVG